MQTHTNSTNDGGTTKVLVGRILSVELSKPLNSSSASIEMVQGVGHGDVVLIGVRGSIFRRLRKLRRAMR